MTLMLAFRRATMPSLLLLSSLFTAGPVMADQAGPDEASILANRDSGKDWPSHGFDYAGTRFSPLTQITSKNVDKLGLAWSYDLKST
ncbi:MAG: PQQ-dependent dehydrogenase, methanol/ethanol family, partial [Alloalcanivorax xenomutans]